jgi:hypothetical protein
LNKSSPAALIAAVLPEVTFQDGDILKASAILMTAAPAAASLGGRATPLSLTTAAIWLLAKAGHAKLEITKDIPAPAALFVRDAWAAACATERPGNGFSVGNIRKAISAAIAAAIVRVPAKKEEAAAIAAPVATVEAAALDAAALRAAMAEIMANGAAMDNRAADSMAAHTAKYAEAMAAARNKADAYEAEQAAQRSLAENAYRSLQAEIAALRGTLESVSNAKTLKEVKALIAASGITIAA